MGRWGGEGVVSDGVVIDWRAGGLLWSTALGWLVACCLWRACVVCNAAGAGCDGVDGARVVVVGRGKGEGGGGPGERWRGG